MAEDKEKQVKESYRLPKELVDFIGRLARKQIGGTNRSAVVRTLLNNAVKEMIETDFVEKYQKTNRLLGKK